MNSSSFQSPELTLEVARRRAQSPAKQQYEYFLDESKKRSLRVRMQGLFYSLRRKNASSQIEDSRRSLSHQRTQVRP
ncbi:MAG: hypothetical protein IT335_07625 [Thermomicrobiales bacterium]|nr:hypothetical protein [Thermomicrobiales bacterium]